MLNPLDTKSESSEAAAAKRAPRAGSASTLLDSNVTKDDRVISWAKTKLIKSGNIYEFYHYSIGVRLGADTSKYRRSSRRGESTRNEEYRERTSNVARNLVRRLATTNFSYKDKFLTLTFADSEHFNIRDIDDCNTQFKKFIQRMRHRFGNFHYIAVIEFQDKNREGAIHYHLIASLPYVDQQLLTAIWSLGYVFIRAIDKVDNVGAYLVKYMTKENVDERLKGRKSYFTSRGLMRPEVIYAKDADAELDQLLNEGFLPTYRNNYESDYSGSVEYAEFNRNRKGGGK